MEVRTSLRSSSDWSVFKQPRLLSRHAFHDHGGGEENIVHIVWRRASCLITVFHSPAVTDNTQVAQAILRSDGA